MKKPSLHPVLLCVSLLSLLLVLCGTSAAHAEQASTLLADLRNMRFSGELPALNGYSPAKPIDLTAPVDDHYYVVAYKSENQCVVFFTPLDKNEHDIALQWDGPKCNGQPIEGDGTLKILNVRDKKDGVFYYVSVFKGHFENGMLTGEGEKVNFYFDANGKLREDINEFSGEFAYGLLNGSGIRTWTGSVASEPSAKREKGNFKEGTPFGLMEVSRLHPYKGVEADTSELLLSDEGGVYTYQAYKNKGNAVKGALFFYGDKNMWKTEIVEVSTTADLKPKSAKISRTAPNEIVQAECVEWDIQPDRWSCAKGNAALKGSVIFLLEAKPFSMPLSLTASGAPFRIQNGELVRVKFFISPQDREMTCNEDMSLCRGKAIIDTGTPLYWWGESEFRNGELTPVSGVFLIRTSEANPAKDTRRASCTEFSSPTRCASGVIWRESGQKWEGGYYLKGITYSPSEGYMESGDRYGVAIEHEGRLTFAGGKWADVYAENGEIISVSKCDDPHSSRKFTCRMEDGRVTFVEH